MDIIMTEDNKEPGFDFNKVNEGLFSFLDSSPNAFFAVANMKKELNEAGFKELREEESWRIMPGGSYYVTRNDSAMIAMRISEDVHGEDICRAVSDGAITEWDNEESIAEKHSSLQEHVSGYIPGFQIMASHADSPAFKIKPNEEIEVNGNYIKLNSERYGGMMCAPWMDRPLSAAGRVMVETENGIESRLVNIDRDLLIIPNLAIHMNHDANSGFSYNAQTDMLPLCGELSSKGGFMKLIAAEAGTEEDCILDTELFLYNRMKAEKLGVNGEFIASGRLDDLQCAYASLTGLLKARPKQAIAVHCVYDNEEVGSGTKQGAASAFLKDTLMRVYHSLGYSDDEFLIALRNSFMVSADNAHSLHPNHAEKADPTNRPFMNKGIVIKYSANQKYTTDAVSAAIFRRICRDAGVPYQSFANRSDMPGGSTLGNISSAQLAVNTVDIGLAQLAMHSSYETAGSRDTAYLIAAAEKLYSSAVRCEGSNYRIC